MRKFRVATIVGSNRRESINRQLAHALMRLAASEKFEFELVRIDDLPMYNWDLEKPTERNVWKGKPVAITGTSPGAIGTAVGQQHLRQILGALGSLVMGGEASNFSMPKFARRT